MVQANADLRLHGGHLLRLLLRLDAMFEGELASELYFAIVDSIYRAGDDWRAFGHVTAEWLLVSEYYNLHDQLTPDARALIAESIADLQFDQAAEKLSIQAGEVFVKALENVRPSVEVRSKRVGGANYQVPREVSPKRAQSLGIRWLVDNARKKKGMPMARRLASEFVDACNNTGTSVQWKENVHKMAEANKAYSHFAF